MNTSSDARSRVDADPLNPAMKPTETRLRSSCQTSGFTSRGFTLVELLVVIGIIAVLVGILLPVLGRAQQSARDVKCKANLRSIMQAALMYATEQKGSFPAGFGWNRQSKVAGSWGKIAPASGPNTAGTHWTAWYLVINKQMGGKLDTFMPNTPAGFSYYGGIVDPNGNPAQLNKVFQCPESVALGFEQQVTYYDNSNVMSHSALEGRAFPTVAFTGGVSLKQSKTFSDTIMFYDSPSMAAVDGKYGQPFFSQEDTYGVSAMGVDGAVVQSDRCATFRRYDRPELRFRVGPADTQASFPSYSIYGSIWYPTDDSIPSSGIGGLRSSMNSDLGADFTWTTGIGNVRFRHGQNTSTNAVFADGSVRSFKINRQRIITGVGGKSYETEVKRYMFMPKNPGVSTAKGAFAGTGGQGT